MHVINGVYSYLIIAIAIFTNMQYILLSVMVNCSMMNQTSAYTGVEHAEFRGTIVDMCWVTYYLYAFHNPFHYKVK